MERHQLDKREERQGNLSNQEDMGTAGGGGGEAGFELADARELYLSAPFRWGPLLIVKLTLTPNSLTPTSYLPNS